MGNYAEAMSHFANLEVVRQVGAKKKLQRARENNGVGRSTLCQQPLLFTRRLGHPELIFNDTRVA